MLSVPDLSPLNTHLVTGLTELGIESLLYDVVKDEQKLDGKIVHAAYKEGK